MLTKLSIKKPFTVVVMILIVVIIGVVAIFAMPIDLLPNIELPVMVVATIAPGAAPEDVETRITAPVEGALKSINNVTSMNSVSSENYSLVILQFNENVDLTVATLDIQNQMNMIKGSFPELTMDPIIMKLDPNMLPIMNVAISQKDTNIESSSDYLQDIAERIKAATGVASVSTTGLVENQVALQLDFNHLANSMIDNFIKSIIGTLREQGVPEDIIESIEDFISNNQGGVGLPDSMLSEITNQLKGIVNSTLIETVLMAQDFEMPAGMIDVNGVSYFVKVGEGVNTLDELKGIPVFSMKPSSMIPTVPNDYIYMTNGNIYIGSGLHTTIRTLINENIDIIRDYINSQFPGMGDNIDADMILGLIIDENGKLNGNITQMILDMPVIQPTIGDIARIAVLNNAGNMHTLINGAPGVMLSINKQAGYSTVTVTQAVNKALEKISTADESFNFIVLSDQGGDINFMLSTILKNLLFGAVFAILILLLFLKDIRPTVTVALSIGISVVGALALMYLSGVTLNLVSMGGLALAVGMLVDNSIVVIENIYRKRNEGMSPIKAAYEGTKQVGGAILASTLTTVVVFVPIMFVEGLTKQIFTDLALTITFSLIASLLVALTLVPTMSSRLLKKQPKQELKIFTLMKTGYVKALDFMLNRKWITIVTVIVMFSVSIVGIFFMDKELFPATESNSVTLSVEVNRQKIEELGESSFHESLDDVVNGMYQALKKHQYVENVGIEMAGGGMLGGISIGGMSLSGSSNKINAYVALKEKRKGSVADITKQLIENLENIDNVPKDIYSIVENNSEGSMSSMMATNVLTINVTGDNLEQMRKSAIEIANLIGEKDFGLVNNGVGKPPMEYNIVVDKKKANEYGLYTAQLFLLINQLLTTPSSNATVRIDETGTDYNVYVYGFDYDLTRWYRTKDSNDYSHRVYIDSLNGLIDSNTKFYIISPEQEKIDVWRSEDGKYFRVGDPNSPIFGKQFNLYDATVYYQATPKEPLDLVTSKLNFATILSDAEMSQLIPAEKRDEMAKGIPIYKFLKSESFKTSANGKIVYRMKDGYYIDINGNPVATKDNNDNFIDLNGKVLTQEEIKGILVPSEIVMKEGYSSINHIDGKRVLSVSVTIAEGVKINFAKAEIEKIMKAYIAPSGITVDFQGENELVTETFNSLFLILGLAVVLIYLVMVAQFQSLKSPLIIMFTLPLAFTGSILLLWMCGMGLSIFAMVGLILLVGLVVNSGIVYVDYVNKLMLSGKSKREALLETAHHRLRPILMTALTTIVALLATVFDFSSGAEATKPMAIATIGGLVYATILTLFFVPIMYDLFNRKDRLKKIVFEDDKEDDIEAEMYLDKLNQIEEVIVAPILVDGKDVDSLTDAEKLMEDIDNTK